MFFGGIAIAYFVASLDLFLHDWDEQFHALVAKNLSADFLTPRLVKNKDLIYVPENWTFTSVWLHKQPLFLWQMALSLKCFGLSEIALRLPNILAHGIMAVLIYDIGKLVKNEWIGWVTAILFCYLRFALVNVGAIEATDHNDCQFLLYVTASFWSLFQYQHSGKIKYLILLGVFSGAAVLIKWLTGLIAIGVFGSYALLFERKKIVQSGMALLIACAVFLPWQMYCYTHFKETYLNEMAYNTKHVFEVVEGHSGTWLYHFEKWQLIYADTGLIFFILPMAVLLFCMNKHVSRFHKYCILMSFTIVHLFFSLVTTKMPAFCMIVVPFGMLMIALMAETFITFITHELTRQIVKSISIVFLTVFFLRPSYFIKRHTTTYTPKENFLAKKMYDKQVILCLKEIFKGKKVVFVNAKDLTIKIMYYTEADATFNCPPKEIIDKLILKGYRVIAFKEKAPNYALDDRRIIKI